MVERRLLGAMAARGLLALGAIGLVGCPEPKVSMGRGPREYVASDYPQILDRWTRKGHHIALEELDDLLTVSATYESWEFRWAYVVRYANDHRLTVQQRRELLDRTLAETREEHTFYVALYGTNRRWADLTRPNGAWIVRLIDDRGNETAPARIDAIAKPGPMERTYFPDTTVWRLAFHVVFPTTTSDGRPTISQAARWFGLRFAGAEGNEELHWNIEPTGESNVRTAATEEPADRRP